MKTFYDDLEIGDFFYSSLKDCYFEIYDILYQNDDGSLKECRDFLLYYELYDPLDSFSALSYSSYIVPEDFIHDFTDFTLVKRSEL